MKKKAFQNDRITKVSTNGYTIGGFAWLQHDPNNLNTAQLTVTYSLASLAEDGTVTTSTIPGEAGIVLRLHNVGDDRHLEDWLAGNGTPHDPLRFDYHDIERLVEADIQQRFGIALRKK